jgi:hypothetical protein
MDLTYINRKTIVKCKTLETTARMKTLKSDDVSNVCNPSKSCLKLISGDDEGVGLMGSNRVLKEKLDSNSKRFRGSSTYDLQAISGYPNKEVEDLSFMHTTKIDKDLLMESDLAKTLSLNVDLLESEREKNERDPTSRKLLMNQSFSDGF